MPLPLVSIRHHSIAMKLDESEPCFSQVSRTVSRLRFGFLVESEDDLRKLLLNS